LEISVKKCLTHYIILINNPQHWLLPGAKRR
jgi:hypothetical protein